MKVKLETLLQELSEKTIENNQYPVLTSSKAGIYLQSDYFNKQVASKDNTGYKIIRRGQFTYRAMSDTGEFFPNKMECVDIGIVSPAYPVFSIVNENIVNADYLKYYFKSKGFQRSISMFAQGSTRTSVKYAKLKTITIDLPNMDDQLKMVSVLEKMENVISIRQQALAKYDTLIKARFVEMFGDPIKNPMRWEIKKFEDISSLITDGEHATPRRVDKGIYLLSARNVLNHSIQVNDVDYIDEEEYQRIAKRVVPKEGDVLISCSGSIGRCCVVPENFKFQMVRSAALIRFNEDINPVFAEWLITSDDLQRQIIQSATQSSQANLFQGKIRQLHGYVPPKELQDEFADFVTQVDKLKFKRINIIPEGGFHLWK